MERVIIIIIILVNILTSIVHVECAILAVKCCPQGEQLSQDLKNCVPINAIRELNIFLIGDSNNSNVSETNTHSYYKSRTANENNGNDLIWLPKHLKVKVEKEMTVFFGGMNNCNKGHTIRLEMKKDANRFSWLSNGSLILHSDTAWGNRSEHFFGAQEFCSDTFTDSNEERQTAILLCACNDVRCVRKCCPKGQSLSCSHDNCECISYDTDWRPFHPNLPRPEKDFSYEIVIDGDVKCDKGFIPTNSIFCGYPPYLLQRFWNEFLNGGEMCGDMIVGKLETPKMGMLRCMREIPFFKYLDNWLHVPEAVFLILAVLTTVTIPRRRLSSYSYVHDLALVCHTLSLLIRSLLWTVYLVSWSKCNILPIFVYFFSVAASLWLNVLCMNMACGFWKPLGMQHGRWSGARGMFLCYSLYAWGASACLTAFTAYMWYSLEAPGSLLRPTLHETRTCFREEEADGKVATFAYYYGPMGGLLCVNALLFALAAGRVRLLRRHSSVLHRASNSSSSAAAQGSQHSGKSRGTPPAAAPFRNEQSLVIYLKLLWLMGVMEMAVEIVTWASNSHIYYNALIVGCLDIVRSVAIFVFCCCKWRTLRALRDRFCACSPLRLWRPQHSDDTDLPEIGGEITK